MDIGCTRQTWSRVVSCITTNAGTPCCLAASRLHWRRYSRNSASTPERGVGIGASPGMDGILEGATDFEDPAFEALIAPSHSGRTPQASHDPQVSHLVRSPKCEHI